jgi:uncharacterized repeat protein (TIGR03803 family)
VLTTLVNFNNANGASPQSGLTLGNDGLFYGMTDSGGSSNMGTVFKITTNGTLTTLVNFTNGNGANPESNLALGREGSLYGTTTSGGSDNFGVLFRLDLPSGIISQPASRTNNVGTTANFAVSATGTQPFSYQWRKNGTNIVNGGNVSGASDSTLALVNVQTNDAGNFTVVVSNNWGSVTSSVAVLTVQLGGTISVESLQVGVPGPYTNTLTFAGNPSFQYLVQFATNLSGSPWFILSTNIASANGTWTVLDPTATNAQRFYRVLAP